MSDFLNYIIENTVIKILQIKGEFLQNNYGYYVPHKLRIVRNLMLNFLG